MLLQNLPTPDVMCNIVHHLWILSNLGPFSVLTAEERQQLFPPVLPAFVRFCKAFPPLMEDVVGLLLQYGRICASEDSLQPPLTINGGLSPDLVNGLNSITSDPKERQRLESLPQQVQDTFAAILDNSVLEKRLYWNKGRIFPFWIWFFLNRGLLLRRSGSRGGPTLASILHRGHKNYLQKNFDFAIKWSNLLLRTWE